MIEYKQTQKCIDQQLVANCYPGVVYGIATPSFNLQQAKGWAEINPNRRPVTLHTLFDLASLTKVIGTTTVVLQLLEQQHIQIDTPLKAYIGDFQDETITLRQLLTHTSDITSFIANRNQLSAAQLRTAYLGVKAGKNRGQYVRYTDTGMILLGFMLEEIFRQPVQQIIQENVLTPLGMTQSGFSPKKEQTAATELDATRGLLVGEVHDPKAYILQASAGHAGLFSNVADLTTYAQMLFAEGQTSEGKSFLQPETVASLFRTWTPAGQPKRSLGWQLLTIPKRPTSPLLYHTGYTGTFMVLDLQQKQAFIFLSNRVHPIDRRASYLVARDALLDTYLQETYQTTLEEATA